MKNILTWFPRLLGLLFSGFMAILALDAFSGGGGIWRQLGAFVLHLIPAFLVLACVRVAWQHRILGGLLCMLLGMLFAVYFGAWRDSLSFAMLALPLMVAGAFFLLSKWGSAE